MKIDLNAPLPTFISESLIVVEFDEFYNPKEKFRCPSGIRRPHQLFVFNTIQDKMLFITTKSKSNSQVIINSTMRNYSSNYLPTDLHGLNNKK